MNYLTKPLSLEHSQGKNDCGPCVTTMMLNYFLEERLTVPQIVREMGPWRIPKLGATLPWGIVRTLRRHGLGTVGGWFGRLEDIKAHIDADHPVIVLVRPTDLEGVPFFSLHYRVVVGYNDINNGRALGGGELFFNCSARSTTSESDSKHFGNLALGYTQFRRQWLTWVSINWYVAAYPRKAGLG